MKPRIIHGTKFVYELKEGEQYAMFRDLIIVVHPEHKPKIVFTDGTVRELEFVAPL